MFASRIMGGMDATALAQWTSQAATINPSTVNATFWDIPMHNATTCPTWKAGHSWRQVLG